MPHNKPRIGVLAIQGDVLAHQRALERAGADAPKVRRQEELAAVDGLVIPGGESTTVGMLLERFGLMEPLRERIQEGMPVFGTCTGLILLAKDIAGSAQPRVGTMDVAVERNAYGRQVDSFETDVPIPEVGGDPVRAVFIRAPQIKSVGPEVEVLAKTETGPLLIRQGNQLAAAFHPELTGDDRVHRLFVRMVEDQ